MWFSTSSGSQGQNHLSAADQSAANAWKDGAQGKAVSAVIAIASVCDFKRN